MEGEKTADGEKELTSTSSTAMENLLSTNNIDEKSGSNDSLPTSSTDASTSIKSTLLVSDDPISSTSSEIMDPSKAKSSSSVTTDAVDNACASFDTEAELLAISNVDRPSGKIEENVDDLVNDLETLLGESNSFTCSRNAVADAKKREVSSNISEVIPAPNKDKLENEVSSNTDTAPDKIQINVAEEIEEAVLPNNVQNAEVVESLDNEPVVVIQSEVKGEEQEDETTEDLAAEIVEAQSISSEKCQNESDVTNEFPSVNHRTNADSGSSELNEEIEASSSESTPVDLINEPAPTVKNDDSGSIEEAEANRSIDNIPYESVEEPTQTADNQDSTSTLARDEGSTIDHITSQVNNQGEEKNEEESSNKNIENSEFEKYETCDDAVHEETTNTVQEAHVSEDVENSGNGGEKIEETVKEKDVFEVGEVITDYQKESVQVEDTDQDGENEESEVNVEEPFDNAQLLEENIIQSELKNAADSDVAETSEENTEVQVKTISLNETFDVSEEFKTEEQEQSSQINGLQEENNDKDQESPSEHVEDREVGKVESFVADVSEEANTEEQEQLVESPQEAQENTGNNDLQEGEELETTASIPEESSPEEVIETSNPVDEDEKISEAGVDLRETTMNSPKPESTSEGDVDEESCEEHVDSNSVQPEQCASEVPTGDIIAQHGGGEEQLRVIDRSIELKESLEAPDKMGASQEEIEQEATPSQLPQEIEIMELPDVAAIAGEAELIDANPIVEELEDNGDVATAEGVQEEIVTVLIVTDPEQARPRDVDLTEMDGVKEGVCKEKNEDAEHSTPLPVCMKGVEKQPGRSFVTIEEKLDEQNSEVEKPSAEELYQNENVAVAGSEPRCDYVQREDSFEKSERIDSPIEEVIPPDRKLEEHHTDDDSADIAKASYLKKSRIEEHTECQQDEAEQPTTVTDLSEKGELAKYEEMDNCEDKSEVLNTETEGEIRSTEESGERSVTIETADSDNVPESVTEKVTIVDIEKDETIESKGPETEFCEETKLVVEEDNPSPAKESSADEALEAAAECLDPGDQSPMSENNEKIEDVHQDTSECEEDNIDEAKTPVQEFESESSEPNSNLQLAETVVSGTEDDLRNSENITQEIVEVANAPPQQSESTGEKKPAPEINIRRKTVEQDLEKVVCLSEESSDSDINEPDPRLPKEQSDILSTCDEDGSLLAIAEDVDEFPDPELPCEENDGIVSVESHAMPPVASADSASNLETILAVASLQNDSIPDLRGERRLSEKEIREMEAIRMAVASITDSSQDTYDSYLVNNAVSMDDIELSNDNGVQETSGCMEIVSNDPGEIDGETTVIDNSCAENEEDILVQKVDSVDKAEEYVKEINQFEADSDALDVQEALDERSTPADDGVANRDSTLSAEISGNVDNVESQKNYEINEGQSVNDELLEASETNESAIPGGSEAEQEVAENDVPILNKGEVSLPDEMNEEEVKSGVVPTTEDRGDNEVSLPDLIPQPDFELAKEEAVLITEDRLDNEGSLPNRTLQQDFELAKEEAVLTTDDNKEYVTTIPEDKACLSQTPNQNFEIADTAQEADVSEEVDQKIEEADDGKEDLVQLPDATPGEELGIAKEDAFPTTEDGNMDQVSLLDSTSTHNETLEIVNENVASTSVNRMEDQVFLSDSTPNENLDIADEDLVPIFEDKVSLPDSKPGRSIEDGVKTSKDGKEDEDSLLDSTHSLNLDTAKEGTVALSEDRREENLEIATQDTLPSSQDRQDAEVSLPDSTPNQNLKTAEEDVTPTSDNGKAQEISFPDSTRNQNLEIAKEDSVQICEDEVEDKVSLPDSTRNQKLKNLKEDVAPSSADRKEDEISNPHSTPDEQLKTAKEDSVESSKARKEDEVMLPDSTPKEDTVPTTESTNEDNICLSDKPCQIKNVSKKEELTVSEDVKENKMNAAHKLPAVNKKVCSNKNTVKVNEATDWKKATSVEVVSESKLSIPKDTVNAKEAILPEQNNVSVSEGAEEPDAQVVEERPLRSRTRRGNKVSEPLSINVDELDKKEKVYSPKVTIKPVKVPDEEVSTTSEVDGNKGSLKMTITKQSDKMHSILKVFNPEDEAESPQNQEEPIPKLIIKPKIQIEQQHSPKMTTRSSKAYSPTGTRCSSPRVTIKPITKPTDTKTEALSPLKITFKPVLKTEEAAKKHSPKASKEQDQKIANPKITIKPIPKPAESEKEENPSLTPKVTIKPLKRPLEENDAETDQERFSPKITIKPVVKPIEEVSDQSLNLLGPKLKIKPIKKQEGEGMPLEKDDQTSPKISIKPVIKPVEPDEEQEEVKERIVLKINKGTFPSPAKDPKKREHPDDDKLEKVAIKLKFSTTGGHTHIIQGGEESSNKRQRKDSGYSGGAAKKDIEEVSNKRTLEEKPPEKNKRLRSASTPDAITENSNVVLKNVEPKVDSAIVINEDSSRPHQSGGHVLPASTPDISKIVDIASRTTHIETTPVLTVGVVTPTVVAPAPKKRGRPRKIPLVVRQELADAPIPQGTVVAGAAITPSSEVGTPEASPSRGGRPKRSCRGQNVMATLGIKPRKPRGRGRGRGRVNMGDREPPPVTSTIVEPVQTVPMKPEKEPKLSKAKLKLIQKAAEEEAQKQKEIEKRKTGDAAKVSQEKDGAKPTGEGGNKKKECPVSKEKQEIVQKQKGADASKANDKALKGEEETKIKKEAGEKSEDSPRKTLSSEKQVEKDGAEGQISPKKKKEDKTSPNKLEVTTRRQKAQVQKVGGKAEKLPIDTPKAASNKLAKKLAVSPNPESSPSGCTADTSSVPKKELGDTESAPSTSAATAADEVVSISTDDDSCGKVETGTEPKSENNSTTTNVSESQANSKNSSPKRAADKSEEQAIEEKRAKVDASGSKAASLQEDSVVIEDKVEGDKQKEGTVDEIKEEDEEEKLAEDEADSGDDSEAERRNEWIRLRKQEAIKKCRAKRMEKLARAAERKRKIQEQAAQHREARKAAEEAERASAERGRATKRYGRYGVPKPQISLIDEPVQETAGTIKSHMGLFDPETERIAITQPILIDEDRNLDKEPLKHLESQLTPVKSSHQKLTSEPIVGDQADDTPTKIRTSIETEDVVMLDEETRMSADFRGSRAQTPAKQSIPPPDTIVEDSQEGSMSTEGGKSRSSKAPKMEVFQDSETIFTADQLAEYSWNGQGPFMLQEQVTQYLGIKSFKRKYPNISRRPVDMQERDYLKENGLATEAQCDLGLTAVVAQDILDIMYSDFQDKYEDYCRSQREKQARELATKQKALSQFVLKPGFDKLDILEQAVQSAAAWNQQLNKSRREQRKAHMDLQNLTVHYPKSKMKVVPVSKIGHYPVALVPGQFTDHYKEFTPTELNNLPLNTMCYDEIKISGMESDSEDSNSGSGSDSESSSGSSSGDSSCDDEDCKDCVRKIKTEANRTRETDSDDVVIIENDASSSDSVVLVSVTAAPIPA